MNRRFRESNLELEVWEEQIEGDEFQKATNPERSRRCTAQKVETAREEQSNRNTGFRNEGNIFVFIFFLLQ